MCGISGITENNRPLIDRMVDITCHRGPDDRGVFGNSDITMGHSRLSIQDLSKAGHQPMVSTNKRSIIVFNGEIYNFKRLRKTLERDFTFSSKTDTEVILNIYETQGVEGLKKISGIFSFAIWDDVEKKLILVRDSRGIKPMYYMFSDGRLIFSSELKAIYSVVPNLRINKLALNCFFRMGYITGEETIWRGVKKLMPGSMLTFQDQKITIETLEREVSTPIISSIEEAKDEIPIILKNVIRDQLISDVPVGLFLSGGIDSNLILSLMTEIGSSTINTYSSVFDVAQTDQAKFNSDSIIAKKSAKYFESNHLEIHIDENSVLENIEKVVWHMDEPNSNYSLIPNFILAQEASKNNKVVMSGEGGDEIFGGYNRYHSYRLIETWQRFPTLLKKFFFSVAPLLILNRKNRRRLNYKHLVELYLSFAENNEISSTYIMDSDFNNVQRYRDYIDSVLEPFFNESGVFNSLINAELNTWLVDDYLMRADKMSMAHGLENRVPFLDERLVALSKNIEPSWKYPLSNKSRGKQILVDSMKDYLPSFVYDSPKKGWVSPISKWMRGGLKDFIQEVIKEDFMVETQEFFNFDRVNKVFKSHLDSEAYGAQTIWNVVCFQLWYKRFIKN